VGAWVENNVETPILFLEDSDMVKKKRSLLAARERRTGGWVQFGRKLTGVSRSGGERETAAREKTG